MSESSPWTLNFTRGECYSFCLYCSWFAQGMGHSCPDHPAPPPRARPLYVVAVDHERGTFTLSDEPAAIKIGVDA